jgi:acyl-CoA synthetase (AMP-forming)/AMP-acid ligase II
VTRFSTLQQALLERARASACSVHFIGNDGDERTVSYRALAERAQALLGLLQARSVAADDELVILTERLDAFLDTFWACVLGRVIAVPVAQGSADEHRLKFFRIMAKLQRPFVVTDRKSFDRLQTFAELSPDDPLCAAALRRLEGRVLFIEDISSLDTPGKIHEARPDDIAFIQFSSGSTSAPKGVVLTHHNLVTNIAAIIDGMGSLNGDSCLSWMPLTHDMGLIGFHLTPLFGDVDQWLMPTTLFVRRPFLWMLKASEHRITITCSPNFGYKHFLKTLTPDKIAELNLSPIRLIFNGAEPISAALCEDFLQALAPAKLKPATIFPVYGLAEASLAATFPPPGRPLDTVTLSRQTLGPGEKVQPASSTAQTMRFVRLGSALNDCELRIADTNGQALPDGTVGHILLRGGNVTCGYYHDPERTAPTINAEGWLDTGDLGAIIGGELIVTGRYKEIIFVAGQNHYPQDIEEVLARQAGFELGKVAVAGARPAHTNTRADADEVIAFVVFKGEDGDFLPLAKQLRRAVNEHMGLVVDMVVPVRQLPKTTSGKIQRYLLARDYENGTYADTVARLAALDAATGSATDAQGLGDLEAWLLTLCGNYLPGKTLTVNDNFFDLGTSSLTLAQIYEEIDAAYPGLLDVETLFENPSIRAIAAQIHQRELRSRVS